MNNKEEGTYCYSRNGECYIGEFNSLEDMAEECAAFTYCPMVAKQGPLIEWQVDCEWILESIIERAGEDLGDCVESHVWPEGLAEELEITILNLLSTKAPSTYFTITEVTEVEQQRFQKLWEEARNARY